MRWINLAYVNEELFKQDNARLGSKVITFLYNYLLN
jgi:hypothetical protein